MSTAATVGSNTPAVTPAAKIAAAQRGARVVWGLAGLNLAAVVLVLLLLFVVSERWWLGTIVTYLPRAVWGLPAVVLMVAGWIWHKPTLWASFTALLLVLVPIMEFRSPWLADQKPTSKVAADAPRLTIVSANVQGYKPDFAGMLQEIGRANPDVVVIQEARGEEPLLAQFFPDWHRLHIDYYWIGSKYPLKLLHTCETAAFNRVTGILIEVDTPQGPIAVANIHQMTARRGLGDLSAGSLVTGDAQVGLEEFQLLRMAEASELREQIREHAGDRPLIVAGDFNTPSSSSLFQRTWGDLHSAFDLAGVGYGYTSPVKAQKYWVSYLPWARIDHILCSKDWAIRRCQVGQGRGSDHHLITAELAR
jgi:endonuclease/exonuclease/phosphatase (EEP) superfamily protein YafD